MSVLSSSEPNAKAADLRHGLISLGFNHGTKDSLTEILGMKPVLLQEGENTFHTISRTWDNIMDEQGMGYVDKVLDKITKKDNLFAKIGRVKKESDKAFDGHLMRWTGLSENSADLKFKDTYAFWKEENGSPLKLSQDELSLVIHGVRSAPDFLTGVSRSEALDKIDATIMSWLRNGGGNVEAKLLVGQIMVSEMQDSGVKDKKFENLIDAISDGCITSLEGRFEEGDLNATPALKAIFDLDRVSSVMRDQLANEQFDIDYIQQVKEAANSKLKKRAWNLTYRNPQESPEHKEWNYESIEQLMEMATIGTVSDETKNFLKERLTNPELMRAMDGLVATEVRKKVGTYSSLFNSVDIYANQMGDELRKKYKAMVPIYGEKFTTACLFGNGECLPRLIDQYSTDVVTMWMVGNKSESYQLDRASRELKSIISTVVDWSEFQTFTSETKADIINGAVIDLEIISQRHLLMRKEGETFKFGQGMSAKDRIIRVNEVDHMWQQVSNGLNHEKTGINWEDLRWSKDELLPVLSEPWISEVVEKYDLDRQQRASFKPVDMLRLLETEMVVLQEKGFSVAELRKMILESKATSFKLLPRVKDQIITLKKQWTHNNGYEIDVANVINHLRDNLRQWGYDESLVSELTWNDPEKLGIVRELVANKVSYNANWWMPEDRMNYGIKHYEEMRSELMRNGLEDQERFSLLDENKGLNSELIKVGTTSALAITKRWDNQPKEHMEQGIKAWSELSLYLEKLGIPKSDWTKTEFWPDNFIDEWNNVVNKSITSQISNLSNSEQVVKVKELRERVIDSFSKLGVLDSELGYKMSEFWNINIQ